MDHILSGTNGVGLTAAQSSHGGVRLLWAREAQALPVKLRVPGLVDLARAAGADGGLDLVRAEASARGKGHGWKEGIICQPDRSG